MEAYNDLLACVCVYLSSPDKLVSFMYSPHNADADTRALHFLKSQTLEETMFMVPT